MTVISRPVTGGAAPCMPINIRIILYKARFTFCKVIPVNVHTCASVTGVINSGSPKHRHGRIHPAPYGIIICITRYYTIYRIPKRIYPVTGCMFVGYKLILTYQTIVISVIKLILTYRIIPRNIYIVFFPIKGHHIPCMI